MVMGDRVKRPPLHPLLDAKLRDLRGRSSRPNQGSASNTRENRLNCHGGGGGAPAGQGLLGSGCVGEGCMRSGQGAEAN